MAPSVERDEDTPTGKLAHTALVAIGARRTARRMVGRCVASDFEATNNLNATDKAHIQALLEGILLRHQAHKITQTG